MVAWYIPLVSDDAKKMAAEVAAQHMPLLEDVDRMTPWDIFFYGSIEGMKNVQRLSNSNVVIDWCDWSKLACVNYYAKWGDLLLTRDYGFYPLAEVKRLQDQLWSKYPDREGYVYVRPNDNDKVFSGGVFRKGFFEPWLLQAEPDLLTDDLLCLVGKPSPIGAEYRLVVADGKVIAGSQYLRNETLETLPGWAYGAMKVAERAAEIWSPHPVFVLDVAESYGQFLIIECGSIHTCGLYDCNLSKVVRACTDLS